MIAGRIARRVVMAAVAAGSLAGSARASLSPRTLGMGDASLATSDVLSGWANPAVLGSLEAPVQVAVAGGQSSIHGAGWDAPVGAAAAATVGSGWTVAALWRLDEARPVGGSWAPAGHEVGLAAGWGRRALTLGVSGGVLSPSANGTEGAFAARLAGRLVDAGANVAWSAVSDGAGGTASTATFLPGVVVHDPDRRWLAAAELVGGVEVIRGGAQARRPLGGEWWAAARAGGVWLPKQPVAHGTATAGASVGGAYGSLDYAIAADRGTLTHLLALTTNL